MGKSFGTWPFGAYDSRFWNFFIWRINGTRCVAYSRENDLHANLHIIKCYFGFQYLVIFEHMNQQFWFPSKTRLTAGESYTVLYHVYVRRNACPCRIVLCGRITSLRLNKWLNRSQKWKQHNSQWKATDETVQKQFWCSFSWSLLRGHCYCIILSPFIVVYNCRDRRGTWWYCSLEKLKEHRKHVYMDELHT